MPRAGRVGNGFWGRKGRKFDAIVSEKREKNERNILVTGID
jgi:hypothetical protein